MIDNEIINALECLHKRILQSKCAEEITETEIMGLVNAPNLINRQRAKIKEFDEKVVIQQGLIDYQKAEIERLNIESETLATQLKGAYEQIHKLNMAKSEIIKEFAERLKENLNKDFRIYGNCTVYDFIKHTDNLVKEMTE